ncbi:MAG TPA: MotA/TolQ/ExbB proton channel family protein [Ferrovibrio sp.]|jgi:biopolymer transport protein ExbB/TolQ|uniref:MotA/TolQ/ExbB proton channel family protein n=1 Tax=Ferrovibrio sp. TaxID=1917215 RepID=UPI002B4AC41D|nr:MotA/TolQ/ExbB proton channel family protein [Ferrovibrio sp.]HLT78885.1 MotA/TolQ/ExbB proton channel family protein [Ferrovibrio sp.]
MQHDFSFATLVFEADPVVQAVMALLVMASVACWAIVFEKLVRFARLRGAIRSFENAVKADALLAGDRQQAPGLPGNLIAAAAREKREGLEPGETRSEFRRRLEAAMRQAMVQHLRQVEPGLPFLATVGSAAPFVGLFGTVWGIMNSFTAIAGSNDTSLAVVAPGIAEALFATALGLVAAIPAVIAYNKLSTDLGRMGQRTSAAIAEAARQFARAPVHPVRQADAGQ